MGIEIETVAVRSGTTEEWAAPTAPILRRGELGVDLDLHDIRPGDGVSPFHQLTSAVGAAETAYFTATLAGTTSGNSEAVALVPRTGYPERPWASIVEGNVVLSDEAGGCFASIIGQCDLDFTATTASDAPGIMTTAYEIQRNGTRAAYSRSGNIVGTGANLVSLPDSAPDGGLVFGGALNVFVSAYAEDGTSTAITDGAANHIVSVNITRLAPAPTLPA